MKKKWLITAIFAIVGFQILLFGHRTIMMILASNIEKPDTVYVFNKDSIKELIAENVSDTIPESIKVISDHPSVSQKAINKQKPRRYECFRFNPNTATKEELERLGFSEKQAQSILNYRNKGGKFKRKIDFQASYVVSDSLYQRLKNYIYIPKIDINKASQEELKFLPGIGDWYSGKIVEYRTKLHGFSYPLQLMDLWNFDGEKYEALADMIICSPNEPYPLWELPEDSLRLHPYIGRAAHDVIKFKKRHPREEWTVENLIRAEIIKEPYAYKFKKCNIQGQ